MSADDTRRMNVFEGNVVLTKGTIAVRADRIVVRQDAEGFQHTTATGKPVRFRQRRIRRTARRKARWMDGEALRIEIDDRKQTIELFDNARVNRGGDEVAGNYIFVDQRSDFFSVSAGKGGEGRPGEGRSSSPRPTEAEEMSRAALRRACASATSRAPWCRTSRSRCRAARWSGCSARTAPARPPAST